MPYIKTKNGYEKVSDEKMQEIEAKEKADFEEDKTYFDKRRERILKDYPIHTQLEAITENAMGRPEKLNLLIAGIEQIKVEIPKEEEEAITE